MLARRHQHLYAALADAGLDGLVVNPGPSLRYLTGLEFHLMERPVVGFFRAGHSPALVLPALEGTKVAGLSFALEAITYGEDPATWGRAFETAIRHAALDSATIGVEPRMLRFLELEFLTAAAPGASFVSGEAVIAALRQRKDAEEIDLMRQATRIAQDALEATLPALQVGVTERQVKAELINQLLRHGSDSHLPFDPIVCFGENAANPHAVASDRALVEGDLILIDWGAGYEGYFSDLTRMFYKGSIDPVLANITDIVHQANRAGREAAGPSVAAGDIDRAARRVIEDAGYGDKFIHRTGHGLGMETHEDPYIRDDNTMLLEQGMTFTIEPGIYLEGHGGARIEDDMVITDDGAESLSSMPRALRQV